MTKPPSQGEPAYRLGPPISYSGDRPALNVRVSRISGELKWRPYEIVIDTGSDTSYFNMEQAEDLGFSPAELVLDVDINGLGLNGSSGHQLQMRVKELTHPLIVDVTFTAIRRNKAPVLGTKGFLQQVVFGLVHEDRVLMLSHYHTRL